MLANVNALRFVLGLLVAVLDGVLLVAGVIESGVAAVVAIVAIGLIASSGARREQA